MRKVTEGMRLLKMEIVDESGWTRFDSAGRLFWNMNTPADYEEARRILESELHARNGYNTYVIAGLPQGPIANPGRASIAAVLDPAPTPALYFVADGTGGHVFATTLAEHNANVERWRALRRARGQIP